jgi:hypothetical protein
MTSTTDTLLAQLHAEQRRAYEQAEAADAAARAQYPDAQWDGPALRMPCAPHDPAPAEQQVFADRYRSEHADADRVEHNGETPIGRALYEWRDQEATRRWVSVADGMLAAPACDVCGASSRHEHVEIGGQTRFVCPRCRPSVAAAWADAVAHETLDDGRTRGDAARELVATLLASNET